MTCHFCIVGCGYHVYKWDENREGGRAASQNALGLDFRRQVPPMAVTMTRAMTNTITDRDGKRWNMMIVPDKECAVNRGCRRRAAARWPRTCTRLTASAASVCEIPRIYTAATSGSIRLGQRAGAVRGPDQEDSRHRRAPGPLFSTASTMAAPAAASRTPGAPAS